MDLSVIIPTRDRLAVVGETLDRLEDQLADAAFEAIVVDDGSTDGTFASLERRARSSPLPLTPIRADGRGPAAARNLGLATARAPVCLFIDDDTWPRPGLLARHRDFHARHPEPEAALLGFVDIAADPPPTPFMRWLAAVHLGGYARIEDPADAGGVNFFTGNVSVKTEFLRAARGFDEEFAWSEDIELGCRLERHGLRLHFDRDAAVEHFQPTDLPRAIQRMVEIGRARTKLGELYPGHPQIPRRPGVRHRVKCAVLTSLALARIRTPKLQREIWRFLCHEASREGYWDAIDVQAGRRDSLPPGLRIGRTLARLASRETEAQLPRLG